MKENGTVTQERLDELLRETTREAQELNIPVPVTIADKIKINSRPKKRFGCCRRSEHGYEIEVSAFILVCEESKIKNVIAHEVLHTCEGCYDHGNQWKEYAQRMNRAYGYQIKRTSSFAEMGLKEDGERRRPEYKYIIKCQNCGKEYPRQRFTRVMKQINKYRCNCGGRLTVYQRKP